VTDTEQPTSGTSVIDALIDEVRIGDNLVFAGDADAPLDLLVERFVAAVRDRVPLVIVTVAEPWTGPVPDGVRVLDWSAVTTGRAASLPGALPVGATVEDARGDVRAADEAVGTGAAFVFDRLSAVQAAWSDDAALELFLSTCPRLYRRRSLALWPVELEAHRPSFLRRLTEITQVVVEVTTDDGEPGEVELTVRKADGRPPEVMGRTRRAKVVAGDLIGSGEATSTRERLGTLIRDQRLARELAQAEVARRVGISPSALSQVERGVRGPSGDTLIRLWEVLGVPFGPREDEDSGYRISRRSGRERVSIQEGLTAERLLADPAFGELWLLEIAPGAQGNRAPFAVKSAESVVVVRGVLDLTLAGRTETLHEGDGLLATRTPVSAWANPADTTTEVLWSLHLARATYPSD